MGVIKIEKQSLESNEISPPGSDYPWGTELRFESELVDQIDVNAFNVGDVVVVRGLAVVSRKSEHTDEDMDNGGKTEKNMSIQMTEISVEKQDKSDRADKLYGGGNVE